MSAAGDFLYRASTAAPGALLAMGLGYWYGRRHGKPSAVNVTVHNPSPDGREIATALAKYKRQGGAL